MFPAHAGVFLDKLRDQTVKTNVPRTRRGVPEDAGMDKEDEDVQSAVSCRVGYTCIVDDFQSSIDAVHLGSPAMAIGDHVRDGPTTKFISLGLA